MSSDYEKQAQEWLKELHAIPSRDYVRSEVVKSLTTLLERIAREERERCATVCENAPLIYSDIQDIRKAIAREIRRGGEAEKGTE